MPLAEQLRPKKISDIVGQDHLLNGASSFARMIGSGKLSSMVLWGPPGCGKTTLARLLGLEVQLEFVSISAIFSGVAELKKIFESAKTRKQMGNGTLLFVDEIHRFNRVQQDAFLPHVENGTIILVGATTENPSFELNGALLSRLQVFVLNRLDQTSLEKLLSRAEVYMGRCIPVLPEARSFLLEMADGDGRYLINLLESLYLLESNHLPLSKFELSESLQKRALLYDKNREEHYNLISAFHKSIRGSDPEAALYWLMRMLEGGEDPRFIGRRLIRMAVEDIGLADGSALSHALSALEMYERLGSPEGEIGLSQAVLYLALAPKSNRVYKAHQRAQELASKTGALRPPCHILNAPTRLMKEIGYGEGYLYDHDLESGVSGQNYWPESLKPQNIYEPSDHGEEKFLKERLQFLKTQRHK